ncbi:MAG: TonB-dependent receptor [Nitrospira sp.]|nr:TonB-dependent receptor [Nitrospira sp. NTP2]MCK6492989.1 TonB-dependent receptor [Nitrospira sp.]MEB2337915.1 TonB-dependent receptor [Nitrospirales bacterium]QOJ35000.1 MAG: TonB-dependent receptor [Nitrospira sp.]RIK59076.1 MAG: TonB-dependent receptor [Nitrospira sp.]
MLLLCGAATAHATDAPTPPPTASETSAPIQELALLKEEEMVSIATRYEQPISHAPSNVYVITDEDIRHSGATDIPTVLRRVPGLDVMQVTGADFNVSARGDNQLFANKMLVMVDGRSIYIDGQGLVFWKSLPVTLPEIKRIEVLKGPASVVYGFNAFDGVINIITKSPQEMKGTTLQFGGGELGTISSAAVHAGSAGHLDYRLSIGRDQNQQWRNGDALAFRSHKFNVQTQYNLSSDASLRVAGGFIDTNRFDGPVSNVQIPQSRFNQGYADVQYQLRSLSIRGWWQGNDIPVDSTTHPLLARFVRQTNALGGTDVSFTTNTYNLEAQHSLDFGATNRLSYGLNYRYNTVDGSAVSTLGREDRFGFHLQDEWRPLPSLTLVAGVRYDLHSKIAGTWSPRVALLYALTPDHSFRISGSVAYRPPTLFESNLDLRILPTVPPLFAPIPLFGSQGLSPEQIVSYEAGYQGWWMKHRLRTRLDLFFNHLSDLINFRTVGTTRTLVNGGEADIYGTEAGVEWLAAKWLSGFANVSYQKIGQTFSGVARRGGPDWKANVGVRGDWESGVNAEVTVNYVASATYPLIEFFTALAPLLSPTSPVVDSYTLLNLRAGYRFWHDKAEVAVAVLNALNDRHREHPLGDVLGSRVMGWMTLTF